MAATMTESQNPNPLAASTTGRSGVLHVPDFMVHDSPEEPYPWADGPEREEILDRFCNRPLANKA